jgi:hypothetical protein
MERGAPTALPIQDDRLAVLNQRAARRRHHQIAPPIVLGGGGGNAGRHQLRGTAVQHDRAASCHVLREGCRECAIVRGQDGEPDAVELGVHKDLARAIQRGGIGRQPRQRAQAAFQFVRQPDIILVGEGHGIRLRQPLGDGAEKRVETCRRSQIAGWPRNFNAAPLPGSVGELGHHGPCVVLRAIVTPIKHPILMSLAQQAVQLLAQEGIPVERRQQDRNALVLWTHGHGQSPGVISAVDWRLPARPKHFLLSWPG